MHSASRLAARRAAAARAERKENTPKDGIPCAIRQFVFRRDRFYGQDHLRCVRRKVCEVFMDLIEQIERYAPYNEQEERDKSLILDCLYAFEDIFTRENRLAHMTASAWIANETFDRVLMAYHNIYDSWAWLGGHADGEEDLLAVALREVREESGVTHVRPASRDIFSLEALTVDGHVKRGEYVSSHLHLNVTYLLIADDADALAIKPDENSGVKWFTPEGAVEASGEPWYREHIYKKLNEKMARFRAEKIGRGEKSI